MRQILLPALSGLLVLLSPVYAQNSQPLPSVPGFPFDRTGLITSGDYTGSGSVVSNPRVVASCAHVVFDETLGTKAGAWVNDNRFYLAYFSADYPTSGGVALRGYMRWAAYATYALTLGSDSNKTFSQDFVAHFTYSDIVSGPAADFWPDGRAALVSTRTKAITGYPAGLYATPSQYDYVMHSTGNFTQSLKPVLGRYLEAIGPSTGAGNSGGPAWVFDDTSSTWKFAGVLVSGEEVSTGGSINLIGVTSADPIALRLLASAAASSNSTSVTPTSQTFSATGLPVTIPDSSKTGVSIPITVSGLGSRLASLKITLDIPHPYPNDLQIYLRSPNGRSIVIANRPQIDATSLTITSRTIEGFAGLNPNGVWRLVARDMGPQDEGQVADVKLEIGTR